MSFRFFIKKTTHIHAGAHEFYVNVKANKSKNLRKLVLILTLKVIQIIYIPESVNILDVLDLDQ